MISKNMKVGEVFQDGANYYKVDSIVPEGYISHMVEKPQVEVEQVEKPKRTRRKAD